MLAVLSMISFAMSLAALFLFEPDWNALQLYLPREFPARAQYFYSLAQNRHELRDYEGAIGDYNSALQFNPRFGLAYLARGTAHCELQREQDAVSDFRRAAYLFGSIGGRKTSPGSCEDWRRNYRGTDITRSERAWYPGR